MQQSHQRCPTRTAPPAPHAAGLVFLAFGLNWVDVGGLLGGRLDEDLIRIPAKGMSKVEGAGGRSEVKRAATM